MKRQKNVSRVAKLVRSRSIWGVGLTLLPWAYRRYRSGRGSDPLAVLEKRFAKGKMSFEEFEEAKAALRR